MAFPTFKHWDQRSAAQSVAAETAELNAALGGHRGGQVMAVNAPPVEGLGNAGGFALRLQDRGGIGLEALGRAKDEFLQFLDGKIAKWWMPDDMVVVQELPHTATGKLLKTELRKQFADYRLPGT